MEGDLAVEGWCSQEIMIFALGDSMVCTGDFSTLQAYDKVQLIIEEVLVPQDKVHCLPHHPVVRNNQSESGL